MKIAFFGAGLMGAGFIRRMLHNGHQVNVWSRDPAKAKALETDGAKAFADAAEAIKDVDRIHLCRSPTTPRSTASWSRSPTLSLPEPSSSTTRRPRRRRPSSASRAGRGGTRSSFTRRC